MFSPRFLTIAAMIFTAALSRLLPHPWNFSPVGAMALFAGAHFSKKSEAFLIPVAAMLLSDVFLGFHAAMPFVYASFCINVLIGMSLRQRKSVGGVAGASLAGSIQFFIVTNFAAWVGGHLYPLTAAGLVQSYVRAIPFFSWTLLGDAFYTALLFGSFALAARKFPALQQPSAV